MFEKLKYIEPMMNEAVEKEFPVGAQIAVIHKGETVYRNNFGYADREKKVRMGDDNIFRLFSLSKPITAAAAMILLERGKIELRYPIKWFLPTFDAPKVLDGNGLRPAVRDITIRDLLNMTSGICYPDGSPAGQEMGKVWGRLSDAQEKGEKTLSTREFALEMGSVPLAFDPGEKWMYGASADVMGAVIEAVSGMKLSEFLAQEIFEPLGMKDTGFYVPENKMERFAARYNMTEKGNEPYFGHDLCLTDYTVPPTFESGGAGLVSTIEDYSKFVKMLMGSGTYNGVNILGRKTVELMRTDGFTAEQYESVSESCWDSMVGQSYSNFMRILRDPAKAGSNGTKGEYGWDGWMGCYFCIDPKEELAFLYFIQQTNSGCTDFVRKLQHIIWGALD